MVHEIKDSKLSVTDISNTEGKSGTWFWKKSSNKSDSDIEEDKNSDEDKNGEEENQEEGEFKT